MPDFPPVLPDVSAAVVSARGRRPAWCLLQKLPRVLVVVLVTSAVSTALAAPAAQADDLSERRDQLQQQLAHTRADLNESSSALTQASAAVEQAQSRLDEAQARLARTRHQLNAARAQDVAMAATLRQARTDLAQAKAAVRTGQAKLDAKVSVAGEMVRTQYQQQTNLAPIAVLIDPESTSDLATRLQWATTMFDTTQSKIDELTTTQRQLSAERARQAILENQIAADRAAAADSLETTRQLDAQAAVQASSVAGLLSQRQSVQQAAASDVAQDKTQYASLTRERAAVEQRITARIAAAKAHAQAEAKAAAARRAAAERAAATARQVAAKARPMVHVRSRSKVHVRSGSTRRIKAAAKPAWRPSRSAASRTVARARTRFNSSGAHHGFVYPSDGPITSPFGMRLHPVLHVWKLHDGTDFGAGCGAPIRAAYAGTVAERYFNAGYGNRLIIDHGRVDGRYVSTAYNHAIRYVVSPGQHVSRGQLIGYVGETGYATGCHLHLMVYLGGRLVNPMTWY